MWQNNAMRTTWDPKLYQDEHSFVWERAKPLLDWLNPQRGEKILDLGCGTGQLTHFLKQSGAKVVGVDGDAAMIEAAKQNYPDIPFHCVDARHFTLQDIQSEPFDAIFSNAVLHWIKPPEAVIECMWKCLKPGGRLVAEMGGQHNMEVVMNSITQALSESGYSVTPELNPWFFPSSHEYRALLEGHGFEVLRMEHFERHTPLKGEHGLANWIQMFGNSFLQGVPEKNLPKILERIEEIARPKLYRDGPDGHKTWIADYWRLRFEAESPTF